jgi:hypothetical protein
VVGQVDLKVALFTAHGGQKHTHRSIVTDWAENCLFGAVLTDTPGGFSSEGSFRPTVGSIPELQAEDDWGPSQNAGTESHGKGLLERVEVASVGLRWSRPVDDEVLDYDVRVSTGRVLECL